MVSYFGTFGVDWVDLGTITRFLEIVLNHFGTGCSLNFSTGKARFGKFLCFSPFCLFPSNSNAIDTKIEKPNMQTSFG